MRPIIHLYAAPIALKTRVAEAKLAANIRVHINLPPHGVGANKVIDAQAAEQLPRALLHPIIAAGAAGAAIVPKVAPAAA